MAKRTLQHNDQCTCVACTDNKLNPKTIAPAAVPDGVRVDPQHFGPFETIEQAIAGGVPPEFFEGEGAPRPPAEIEIVEVKGSSDSE